MKIVVINGPNLNLLGVRETSIYGDCSFEQYFETLQTSFSSTELIYFQSNIEGEIIDTIHKYGFDTNGIVLNAGAYTHTSVAIRDAISGINAPVIEVHISNILTREEFRHSSIIGPACKGSIMGLGLESYRLAIEYLTKK